MKFLFLALFSASFLISCQTTQISSDEQRSPQSVDKNQFRKTLILSKLAQNRIIFIAEDSFYREKPAEDGGKQCLLIDEPIWNKIFDNVLAAVEKSSESLSSIHAIRFSLGAESSAKISLEDGYSILDISYMKKTTYKKMESILDVPCSSEQVKFIGKQKSIRSYQWPTEEQIGSALTEGTVRLENVEWFSNGNFLNYLAKQQVLFVINNEKFIARSQKNLRIIIESMEQLNREVTPMKTFKNFEMLSVEISKRSEQGTAYRVLTMKSDMMSHGGIHVDATSTISRRMNQGQTSGLTMLYLVLNNHHEFKLSGIEDLNQCLGEFVKEKEDADVFSKKYDPSGEALWYPGYKCP